MSKKCNKNKFKPLIDNFKLTTKKGEILKEEGFLPDDEHIQDIIDHIKLTKPNTDYIFISTPKPENGHTFLEIIPKKGAFDE